MPCTLPPATIRALREPVLTAAAFTPMKFTPADTKAWFANHFLRFVSSDFPKHHFTLRFYRQVMNTFGHIAHYDTAGYWAEFFTSTTGKIEFIEQAVHHPCYGDPTHTFSDVEREIGQGWHPHDYLRCLDRMPDISKFPVLGVGSMCRRHVDGDTGILRVVDVLDRALGSSLIRLHLFGLKTTAMAELSGHPRIASVDSQAYGVAARKAAHQGGFSESNASLARVMTGWYRQQQAILARPPTPFQSPLHPVAFAKSEHPGPLPPALAARLAETAEELRALYEAGEIEWTDLTPSRVWDVAFA
jgi:hypothetical protein